MDIDFGGYAVFNKYSITTFIDQRLSRAANFVQNKIRTTNIDIADTEDTTISLSIIESKSEISFEFNGDNLEKIKISISTNCNIEEAYPDKNKFTKEEIDFLQTQQSETIKKDIEDLVTLSKEEESDFLKIGSLLKIYHPYKWNSIKDNWEYVYKETPVEVEVNSTIRRTYDIMVEKEY